MDNCNFHNVTSLRNHASVAVFDGVGTRILNSNFTNNYATQYEATLNVGSSDYLISNCRFENNYGDRYNSVLRLVGSGQVEDCVFINNTNRLTEMGRGGVIGMYNRIDLNVTRCTFVNNTSPSNGAAINVQMNSKCNIINSTFINNTAKYNGGAVYFGASDSTISGCTFINNSAKSGGAIYATASGSSVENSTFIGNDANNGANFYAEKGINFIDLKFPALYVSMTGGEITSGLGTSADKPTIWTTDIYNYLNIAYGETTISTHTNN